MAAWKRRKNWAWPDWTYFFGSMVLAPLLDILMGYPLRWMDSGASHLHGKPSNFLEFVVLLVLLLWLDPIGRIMGIPGDAAFQKPDGTPIRLPWSKAQQAVLFLCLAIVQTAAMAGAVAWVMHLGSVSPPDHPYHVDQHDVVVFLFLMGGVATLTFWFGALGLCIGALQDAAEERKRAR